MIKFEIPGEPMAQQRPKFSSCIDPKTGRKITKAYDPVKSKDYKTYIKYIASQHKPAELLQGALKVSLDVYKSIPNSWSNVKKKSAKWGVLRPLTKPDLDNVAKGVLDACTKIIWNDDNQIVELIVRKYYSDNPRIEVIVEAL